ncbi:translation initiation factor IF-2 subunit gamma [Candidatus Bathyarchaeota archaeon]|nr:translation initiation factor IF-2 subunit gamma [Candidatus Bathyarchaeota archaeon]
MKEEYIQPECNIGTLGHVDNGKSTLVQALTGVWTAKHSEELKRGITIRIGYADATFYKCPKCPPPECYTTQKKCSICGSETEFLRMVSFIDCPGHHSLMVTMLSGAALMDGALFVVAADAKFPQAQDREHLVAAQIAGIDKIIIVQNKVDIVSRERALENYHEIKEFIKGTIVENAPIIPFSAQHKLNVDALIEAIEKYIPTPKRDVNAPAKMYILRSFDVNKPGTKAEDLVGGVIGGSITQGIFRVGEEIEIKPGVKTKKGVYEPLYTVINSLQVAGKYVKEAKPGGLVGVGTNLDPSLTKSDGLIGNVVGKAGTLPEPLTQLTLEVTLFEKAVGTKEMVAVEKIKSNEALVLNIATTVTSGIVTSARNSEIEVVLKKPICVESKSKAAISRKIGEGWRLIGYGIIK